MCVQVVPIDTCVYHKFAIALEWSVSISVPCNTWIFFLRLRAIYHDYRIIKYFFFALWSGTLIALGTVFTSQLKGIPLGNGLCLTISIFHRTVAIASLFLLTIFDTAVMVAISIRMMSYSLSNSWKSKVYCLIFGNEMGHTSKVFLKSSQIYYL